VAFGLIDEPCIAAEKEEKGQDMIRCGVIGYGYWGPNIVRNLRNLDSVQVVAICDKSSEALKRAARAYPDVRVSGDCSEVLTSPDIDVVAVITPVWTHYDLAKRALTNGKHVFVEKPFTPPPRKPRN
jgi:predicted dehydrogenase